MAESQSNGRVENAVHRVQGLIRTLMFASERRLNTRIKYSDANSRGWTTGQKD